MPRTAPREIAIRPLPRLARLAGHLRRGLPALGRARGRAAQGRAVIADPANQFRALQVDYCQPLRCSHSTATGPHRPPAQPQATEVRSSGKTREKEIFQKRQSRTKSPPKGEEDDEVGAGGGRRGYLARASGPDR